MPNVLIAARRGLSATLRSLLETNYLIVQAGTQNAAMQKLATEWFDLIICGTQFDDGGLFSFIRHIRSDERHRATPIICVRYLESPLADSLQESVSQALMIAGASAYLDANRLGQDELRQILDKLLCVNALEANRQERSTVKPAS